MIALLSKSDASVGFDEIVDFLNALVIQYALMVNPTIYVSCIKQFWASVSIKKVNDVVKLRALIDEKRVEIFTELARMGYEKPPPKLTFYKAFFSAQWKFLIHNLVQCISAKRVMWNDFSCSMASAVICLATGRKFNFSKYIFDSMVRNVDSPRKVGKGFSRVDTPLFATMLVQPQAVTEEEKDEEDENKKKLLRHWRLSCSRRGLRSWRRNKRSKSSGLKRLRKVGGMIKAIDVDKAITLVDMETQANLGAELQGRKDDDNAATKDASAAKPTEMLKFKEETNFYSSSQENMIVYLKNMAGYKMKHFKGMTYDKVRPIFETEYKKVQTFLNPDRDEEPTMKRVTEETMLQESFKKLKAVEVSGFESTQDTSIIDPKYMSEEDVKNMLEIILVSKFKVEALQSFEDMLKGFDREDLDALCRFVKEKFSTAVTTEDKENALWVELKRLYEPNADDVFLKFQRYMHDPLTWKLYTNCGVHQVSSTRRHDIFMLTNKDYPMSDVVMIFILSAKLQVDDDCEMARDIVMKIFMEANKPKRKSLDTSSKLSRSTLGACLTGVLGGYIVKALTGDTLGILFRSIDFYFKDVFGPKYLFRAQLCLWSEGTKKYRGSNSGDGGNTRDGVKITGRVIGFGGGIAEANLGGEYVSQEFRDHHLVECGIISQFMPPFTLQHNGGYALESVARILNVVLKNKIEKTPYEIWHMTVTKLSYLKVWGCNTLVKCTTPGLKISCSIASIGSLHGRVTSGGHIALDFYYMNISC
nr:hypothetical protein [Tanacetum cinerariifolium]